MQALQMERQRGGQKTDPLANDTGGQALRASLDK
jgi:hypothetical protein